MFVDLFLCAVGGYPNQLSAQSIQITYTEDDREGYHGYAVAKISWTKPESTLAINKTIYRVSNEILTFKKKQHLS